MRTVVGVLRGGPSSEYDVSLRSGAAVLAELDKEKYEPRDLFISRDGVWHLHGVPVEPERALQGVDVVFNAGHGEFWEDGQVQRIFDALGVPYTGSGAFSSATAFNKQETREAVAGLGVKVAHGLLVEQPAPSEVEGLEKLAFQIFRSFPHPAIVKPIIGGSSVGVSVVDNFQQLEPALEAAFAVADQVLIEEFIRGKEATVGIINDFRGEAVYALLPIEIIPPPTHRFFSHDVKYNGQTIERVPGNFTKEEKAELMQIARTVHAGLDLSHYSRSDFILSRRGIYFLEVNTLPGLTTESLLPKSLVAVGSKLSEFLDHVLSLARAGKK